MSDLEIVTRSRGALLGRETFLSLSYWNTRRRCTDNARDDFPVAAVSVRQPTQGRLFRSVGECNQFFDEN